MSLDVEDQQNANRRARRKAATVAFSVVAAALIIPAVLLWLAGTLVTSVGDPADRERRQLERIVDAFVTNTSLHLTDVPDMPGYTWDPGTDCVESPCPHVSVTLTRSDARDATFSLMSLAELADNDEWCPEVFRNLEVPDDSFNGSCTWNLPRNTVSGPWSLTLTLDDPDTVTLTVSLQQPQRHAVTSAAAEAEPR